jgi:hypothetical protein
MKIDGVERIQKCSPFFEAKTSLREEGYFLHFIEGGKHIF